MFPRQHQNQFRNSNADVKFFYGTYNTINNSSTTWNKPPGVSHVYMMLIGPGGNGDGTTGGGSGAVTVWYGAAQNVPDSLVVVVPSLQSLTTSVNYRGSNGLNTLLTANAPSSGTNSATAMTANQFTAMGFFQSVAGQAGSASNVSASTTTFLTGGGYESIQTNYGYSQPSLNRNGFFMLQPVIVGCGAAGHLTGADSLQAGIGCGGAYGNASGGQGGPGLALIASW
jgi:hypothetical protein